jgi:hypothetical protein
LRHRGVVGQQESSEEDDFNNTCRLAILQAGLLIEALDRSAAGPATVGMQDEDDILVLAVERAGDGVLDGPNFVPLLDTFGVVTARGEGDGG